MSARPGFTPCGKLTRLREPTVRELHRLGTQMMKELDTVATLDEIGRELGLTRQNAYHEVALTLGKFVWRLRQRLRLH